MHHACVLPTVQGGEVQCPICRSEFLLDESAGETDQKLPYWHEAEVGAPAGRRKNMTHPEVERPPFPSPRWPTQEEARIHGYRSIKEWYIDYRRRTSQEHRLVYDYRTKQDREKGARSEIERFTAEFVELENDCNERAEKEA